MPATPGAQMYALVGEWLEATYGEDLLTKRYTLFSEEFDKLYDDNKPPSENPSLEELTDKLYPIMKEYKDKGIVDKSYRKKKPKAHPWDPDEYED